MVGVLLGWLGAIPCVQAWLTVMDARSSDTSDSFARRDLQHLKAIKALDLLLETLPQLALQMHVGVSFGELDPSGGSFDWILSWSIFMGLLGPGLSLTSIENLGRNQQRREVRMAFDDENDCAFKASEKRSITHEDFPLLSWKRTYFKVAAAWRASQVTTVT